MYASFWLFEGITLRKGNVVGHAAPTLGVEGEEEGGEVGAGVAVGLGVGAGVAVGLGVGAGVAVGLGVGAGVAVGLGVGAGVAVGLGVGAGVAVGLGVGINPPAWLLLFSSPTGAEEGRPSKPLQP